MKYRSNTHTVNAIQWNGNNRKDIENFFALHDINPFNTGLRFSADDPRYHGDGNPDIIQFHLGEDDHEVEITDWIAIRTDMTTQGKVIPNSIFSETYNR